VYRSRNARSQQGEDPRDNRNPRDDDREAGKQDQCGNGEQGAEQHGRTTPAKIAVERDDWPLGHVATVKPCDGR